MSKKISLKKLSKISEISNGNCVYCGRLEEEMTVDHVIAKVNGGSNEIDNLVMSCKSCNSKKRNKTIEQFRFSCAWEKINYSDVIGPTSAMKLIEKGAIFPGFKNNHLFWIEQKGITFPSGSIVKVN